MLGGHSRLVPDKNWEKMKKIIRKILKDGQKKCLIQKNKFLKKL